MRIAFILPEISGGGIGTYYRNLAQALTASGHEVVVVLANVDARVDGVEFPAEVFVARRADFDESFERLRSVDLFPDLRRKLALSYACKTRLDQLGGADVIEATDYNLNFAAFLLHKTAPVAVWLAGSSGQIELHEHRSADQAECLSLFSLEQILLGSADYLISFADANKAYWERLLRREVHVHVPYFHLDGGPLSTPQQDGPGVVVGRLQLWKGAKFLCDYYAAHPDGPSVEWIGRDNYYQAYSNSMAAHLSATYPSVWGKKLRFTGPRPYAVTQEAIRSATFALVPSTWDTFNFTVIEAMWNGKLVVASSGAGASEAIEDGRTGFVFQANDAESLHAAFGRLTDASPSLRADIQQSASDAARARFGDARLVEQLVGVYRKLAERGIPPQEDAIAFLVEKLECQGASAVAPIVRSQTTQELVAVLTTKALSRLQRLRRTK